MWTMEDVLSELSEREEGENETVKNNGLPPGFRFHPTDEELVTFYLASKVFYNHNITTPVTIAEVDLNRCEPWDLPARSKMGEKEWYLYSLRDRKYPTGLRTNRATGSGYWKATGKDRQVHAASSIGGATGAPGDRSGMLIGMKKTLVFYQGRAPRGVKTRWVMHEYRLDGHFSSFRFSSKEEWVICRIFQKNGSDQKKTTTFNLQPQPLSPFLRCLPPLLDVSSTSSTSSTNQTLQIPFNNNNNNNNNNSNFLLQSLLTNPLPNFSSLTHPTTLFHDPVSAVTGTSDTGSVLFGNPLSGRACHPRKKNNYCEMDDEFDDNENGNGNVDDVSGGFDMTSSVAALDRLLNGNHVNFPWGGAFHP